MKLGNFRKIVLALLDNLSYLRDYSERLMHSVTEEHGTVLKHRILQDMIDDVANAVDVAQI